MHRATYFLESPFATSVTLRPPAGAQLSAAVLDGKAFEFPPDRSTGDQLTITLVARKPSRLSITFSSNESPLKSGSRLLPPAFAIAVPILAGNWTVWLPE